jgi:hypothetical protein
MMIALLTGCLAASALGFLGSSIADDRFFLAKEA